MSHGIHAFHAAAVLGVVSAVATWSASPSKRQIFFGCQKSKST